MSSFAGSLRHFSEYHSPGAFLLLLLFSFIALTQYAPAGGKWDSSPRGATSPPNTILYVPGSVQKICQVTGDTDLESNQPTMSLTQTRFGLVRADHGYSFEHNGKLFFLFGDTHPTATFNHFANSQTDTPRIADDNDAIGYCADSSAGPCLKIQFITNSLGAYKNPVVLNAQGKPAIKLRTNESPISGRTIPTRSTRQQRSAMRWREPTS
jgi:hypothetical protein